MPAENRRPRGFRNLVSFETKGLTAAYWGAIALFTLAFYVTPYLPLIDYHQHVAVAAIMHRMFDAHSAERALYDVNYVTYNGGFHLLVAVLSYVLPPEHAGRFVMSLYPALMGIAVVSVIRESERPRWYAFFALPILYSRSMSWGFANWNISIPIAILGIVWYMRYSRGERHILWRLLLISAICSYTHVLGMLSMCLGVGVVRLSRLRELGDTWGARLRQLTATPLPFMPGIFWCFFVYRYQTRSSFSNWEESSYNGLDDPLWYKLRHLLEMATGNAYDMSDVGILGLSLVLALLLVFVGPPEPRPSDDVALDLRAIRWLAITFFGCYLIIPKVFMATWFIYERFPTLALVFFAGSLPLRLLIWRDEARAAAAGLALAAGANTLRLWATMGEASDASAIINEVPANHKLLAVTYSPTTERISREVFVHLPALYVTRRPGEIAYSFTKFESMPVHYKRGKAPPKVRPGFEWNARAYNVHAAWARAYDITLVHSPSGVEDPRRMVFEDEAYRVKKIGQKGQFFLYDTSALSQPSQTFPRDTSPE
jgi:hypothetical protein